MDSGKDSIQSALRDLLDSGQEFDAAAVVSRDGHTIAAVLPPGYEKSRLGAMSAAILSLGERATSELGRGSLAQVFIEGTDGYVFFMAAGEGAVLTAMVRRSNDLGTVLERIRTAANRVAVLIETELQVEYE